MTNDDHSEEESPAAAFHSAQGYYQLAMIAESREALQQLTSDLRLKPDVLELEILLLLEENHWPEMIEHATLALRLYPKMVYGYVHLAYALHELGKTAEALLALESAPATAFERVESCYNRACYLAVLQRVEEGQEWLNRAQAIDPRARDWAANDRDLESVRAHQRNSSPKRGPRKPVHLN